MAVLDSCCFWRSLRKGTFASAIYSLVYFGCSCIIVSMFLHGERQYLSGEIQNPISESFLEKETISKTTVIFNVLLLCSSVCGVVASILVIASLKCDRRELLVPWIFVMLIAILAECSHFIYLIVLETLDFEPLTATLFTIDFFILCLNIYCLLCVISQYQEYKDGRGTSRHESLLCQSTINIQYIPPAATNICGNAYRENQSSTSPILQYPHTNCMLTPPEENQSNKSFNGSSALQKLPFQRQTSIKCNLQKHVQFPDDLKSSQKDPFGPNNDGNREAILVNSQLDYIDKWSEPSNDTVHNTQNDISF